MYHQSNEYNAETCLDLALNLLIQVGKLQKTVVHKMIKEDNYKELYELLENGYANGKLLTLYRPLRFTSINCLSEALLYLVHLQILEHAETLTMIEAESYVGVFKMLEGRIQQYNHLYCQKKAT
ncbi:hypothetical protein ACQKMN_03845 [Ureibacillus composti]